MPFSFSINHAQKTIETEAVGAITYDEIVDHLRQERDAAGIPYKEFIDATRAAVAFDAYDARRLVGLVRDLAREGAFGPTAVLVAGDVAFGMLRMLEILLEDVCDVRPFRAGERSLAESWLRGTPESVPGNEFTHPGSFRFEQPRTVRGNWFRHGERVSTS